MKFNIANPTTGCQKTKLDDEQKLRAFLDKGISQEVTGDALGEEFKVYVFKIMGGCDKQGFPMKQGVLTAGRVHLLHRGVMVSAGGSRSVRGCIVSQDLSVINLVIVKKGENDLFGLTDTEKPRMRGHSLPRMSTAPRHRPSAPRFPLICRFSPPDRQRQPLHDLLKSRRGRPRHPPLDRVLDMPGNGGLRQGCGVVTSSTLVDREHFHCKVEVPECLRTIFSCI